LTHDIRTFHARLIVIAICAVWAPTGNVLAACKLVKIASLPVTMVDMKPMVTAQINGTDVQFAADSGAFYSMITAASAAEFKLKTHPGPFGLRVTGIGGEADVSVTTIKDFTLVGLSLPIHNIEFLVGGGEVGSGGIGVLGQNVFRIGDVEYDLAKGVITLMHEDGCSKANLAYWVAGTAQTYSVMDIQSTSPLSPHTTGTAVINGVKIRIMFDTGNATSMLSLRAAERAGVKVDDPGVKYAGYYRGVGRGTIKTWIAPFASFKLGDEEIRNTRLRIGETVIDSADMLIGADFFLSHHIYVASGQRKLYFTYNGGPVFNLASSPQPPPSPQAQTEANPSPEAPPAEAASDEPQDAAGFSRRGTAFAARRDFEHAVADLTRACELAPEEPNYFYERGVAKWENKQPGPAMADFDQAIKLKPDDVPALVARAELRLMGKDVPQATEDLNAADRAAAKEADARLRMASAYMRSDLPASAVSQLDLWIAAHGDDARVVGALSERCGARALLGQDLPKALDDCNSALKRIDKADINRAHSLNARGLVRLRLGDYDKSIADYDASLALRPRDAWALYGRGVDKLRRGKTSEAQVDMAAATALFPSIAATFEKHGIHP
jgi:tetratricopeptide (TPR) repeat protein/predicted aspartyl protease